MTAPAPEGLSLAERVVAIVQEELGLSDPPALIDRLSDLGMDSLDRMQIAMGLDQEFDREISDDAAESWTTVQSIVDWLAAGGGA